MRSTTSHWPRRLLAAASSFLLVAASALVVPGVSVAAAGFCSDSTGPQLTNEALTPGSVDVRTTSKAVKFTVKATDDLSGVGSVTVYVQSPTAGSTSRNGVAALKRTSGTALNGTWTGKVTIPRYTNSGKWTISFLFLRDRAGNATYVSTADLNNGGFPSTFNVQSNPDLATPVVRAFSIKQRSVNTRRSTKKVLLRATVTDAGGSGVRFVFVSLGHEVAGKGRYGTGASLQRVRKTNKFVGTAPVPRFADRKARASWLAELSVSDGIGNSVSLSPSAVKAKGWPNKVTVITTPDKTPPVLHRMAIAPKSVTVSGHSSKVTLTSKITDDRSGTSSGTLSLQPVSVASGYAYVSLSLKKGTPRRGTFVGSTTISRCSTTGTWRIASVRLTDKTGNYRDYSAAQLAAKGLQVKLTVN
jgi:hypothetical protein